MKDSLKVRALALSWYGNKRRRKGEVFLLKPFTRILKSIDPKTKKKVVESKYITGKEQFCEDLHEVVEDNVKLQQVKRQNQFGPAMKQFGAVESVPAKSVHEPLSDEESLARDEEEVPNDTDARSSDDSPI